MPGNGTCSSGEGAARGAIAENQYMKREGPGRSPGHQIKARPAGWRFVPVQRPSGKVGKRTGRLEEVVGGSVAPSRLCPREIRSSELQGFESLHRPDDHWGSPTLGGIRHDTPVCCCFYFDRHHATWTANHCAYRGCRHSHHGRSFRGPVGYRSPVYRISTTAGLPLPLNWVNTLLGNVPLSLPTVCAAVANHSLGWRPDVDVHLAAEPYHRALPHPGESKPRNGPIKRCSRDCPTSIGRPNFASLIRRHHVKSGCSPPWCGVCVCAET